MGMAVKTGTLDLTDEGANTYINSDPIYLVDIAKEGFFTLWTKVSGDFGSTDSGVSVIWDGCYQESGASYVIPTGTAFLLNSGTSKTGPLSNGVDAVDASINLFPWIRIKARHNTSASTNSASLAWALIVQ
jgi:hypothetical protein